MIRLHPYYVKDIEDKKIICFGAGENLHKLIESFNNLKIEFVVDNFKIGKEEWLGYKYEIINFYNFTKLYRSGMVMIVTTGSYTEILEQLDSEPLLNDMECYVYSWWKRSMVEARYLYEHTLEHLRERKNKFDGRSKSGRYQVYNSFDWGFHAGAKAPCDVNKILNDKGYYSVIVHAINASADSKQYYNLKHRNKEEWESFSNILSDGDIVFLQHLLIQSKAETAENIIEIKKRVNIKIITFIHDVEIVRMVCNTPGMIKEFNALLKYSDVFIVHNEEMKRLFLAMGIAPNRIVCLELFDYLTSEDVITRSFSKSIIVAGNFEKTKSGYVYYLNEISSVKFHLFGVNYDGDVYNNVNYHGAVDPDKIVNVLPDGFGLVWDGPTLDTCTGNTGEYLRYNNPHKLSMYLAAGIPVIIWEEAAEKKFIVDNGLGVSIKSLYQLPEILSDITEEMYAYYQKNIKTISQKVRHGDYTSKAVEKAEEILSSIK